MQLPVAAGQPAHALLEHAAGDRGGGDQQHVQVALLAAAVEAELVLIPTANVLITLGPTGDFGLIGKINPDGAAKKTDYAQDEFGFSAGLGMYF